MKLLDKQIVLETSGTSNTQAFRMQASRKAFSILSDLYSDKALAIVRELGCNAYDSHAVNGNTNQPIEIHVPNVIEPWLEIRDFGTGISPKDIYDIYTVYFNSTKTESNNQIGCLGLGSKSPFCYSDSFTVTSITNGMKHIYSAYFAENGMPTLSQMGQEKTDEHSGLSILIPIEKDDFGSFRDAVKKAFRFFDVKPTITGGMIEWDKNDILFQGTDWKSLKTKENYAIMGGVAYPIDLYQFTFDERKFMEKTGLVMYFEMGEVDFVPSREALSYCEQTKKSIREKINRIKSEYVTNFMSELKNKENIYEALVLVNSSKDKEYLFPQNTKFSYEGYDITYPSTFLKTHMSYGDYSEQLLLLKNWRGTRVTVSHRSQVSVNDLWMVNDVEKGGKTRIIAHHKADMLANKENDRTSISVFSMEDMKTLVALGIPEETFLPVSTIPKVVRNKATGVNANGIKVTVDKSDIICYVRSGYGVSWEKQIIKQGPNTFYPKYYIKKGSDWNFTVVSNGIILNDNSSIKSFLKDHKISTEDCVMANPENVKKLEANGCVSLESFVKTIKNVPSAEDIATCREYSSKFDRMEEVAKMLPKNNEFRLFVESIKPIMEKSYANYHQITTKGNPKTFQGSNPALQLIGNSLNYNFTAEQWATIVLELSK